jgi:hypothetical protein
MSDALEACALALLRADPEVAVPISRLHDALITEAGADIGGASRLADRLRRRPDLFLLLEPRTTSWPTDTWPRELREEYRDALRSVGLVAEPRVAPIHPHAGPGAVVDTTDAPGIEPLLRTLRASLVELWRATDHDDEARDKIVEAIDDAGRIRASLEALGAIRP